MSQSNTKPRILVTGGSGFIGTNLVEHYRQKAIPVCNLDHLPPRNPNHQADWVQADLLQPTQLRHCIAEFDPSHVVHLGARTDLNGRSLSDYTANTLGVENLTAALNDHGNGQRILYASSRLVCKIGYQPHGDTDYCPTTIYGESKVLGEQWLRQASILAHWAIVRPTSIWGPWFATPYRDFFETVRKGRYLHPHGRRIRKSFGYVGNTVHQIDRLLFAPAEMIQGQTFYLCDSQPLEVLQFAQLIARELNAPPIRQIPLPLLNLAAQLGDLLATVGFQQVPLTRFRLNNLLTDMLHDASNTVAVAGPDPWTLQKGVETTARWLREHG